MDINNLEKFLQKIKEGRCPIGGITMFSDPAVTELMAEVGFDFVFIDGEHGEIDRQTAMQHIMAVRGTDCASLYRVPDSSHTEIKKIIDFAPAGIIVPMVMNTEEAKSAIAAMRYPPEGNRGCGFRRGTGYGAREVEPYWEMSAQEPLAIIQIEHIDAVQDLDSILALPGLGSILVGPYDLSASMGKHGQWDNPELNAVYDEVAYKTKKAGILLGAALGGDYAAWKRRGVDYMAIKGDSDAMTEGFRIAMERFRNA